MKFSRIFFFFFNWDSRVKLCEITASTKLSLCISSQVPRAEIPLIGVDFPKALKSLYQSLKERLRINTFLFIADSADMANVNKPRRKWPKPWFTFPMYISHRSTHHLTYMSLYAERSLQLHQRARHSAAELLKGRKKKSPLELWLSLNYPSCSVECKVVRIGRGRWVLRYWL